MKKFLAGVATVNAFDANDNLLFQSKTMIDDSLDVALNKQEVRAGQGDQLQFIYFHGSALNLTLTESQFNLDFIAANLGTSYITGAPVWQEDTVTLGTGGTGTVSATPIATSTGNIYGWITDQNGTATRVTFTGSNFTLTGGTSGQVVTARYYTQNSAAQQLTVSANIIPSEIRLVLDAQLFSSESGTIGGSTLIGHVVVEVPRCQLMGTQKIDMKSSGVSNTPLSASALVSTVNGKQVYATITQAISSANWYDTVVALAATNDSITVNTASPTATIDLRAVPSVGSAFKPPYADITFASSDATKATVSALGVVTKVAVGSCTITCTITAKNTILCAVAVTVS